MNKWKLLVVLLLLPFNALAQQTPERDQLTATALQITNKSFTARHVEAFQGVSLTHAFEIKFDTAPTYVYTITPCMRGGTCGAATTATLSANAVVTVAGTLADYYTVSVTWSGGTAVTLNVYVTGIPQSAKSNTPGAPVTCLNTNGYGCTTTANDWSAGLQTFNNALLNNNLFVNTGSYLLNNSNGGEIQFGSSGFGFGLVMGTQTALTQTTGPNADVEINGAFTPSSGNAVFAGLALDPQINGTGTGTGYGMIVAPRTNVLTGGAVKIAGFGTTTGVQLAGYSEKAGITLGGVYYSSLGTAIASASTVAPVAGVTHITGTAAIATITVPVTGFVGSLMLIADAAWTTTTGGNIQAAMTAVANTPYMATFDGTKWFIK